MKKSIGGWTARRKQHRQEQQRDAAQRVVDRQQPARVEAVGEPAGGDRADDVEDADDREQRGGRRDRHAVVVGGGHEVGPDQAVGGGAADREGAGEQPERAGAGAPRQDRARARRRRARTARAAASVRAPAPYGAQPHVRRVVAQQQPARRGRRPGRRARRSRGRAPAGPSTSQDSSGRKTSCPEAPPAVRMPRDQAAPLDEPAVGDGRREGQRHGAGAQADQHAPAQHRAARPPS